MTPLDWNDDKAIWEDFERAERMVARRAEARKGRKQKLSVPDDYGCREDEIHDLRRQLETRIREAQTADNRCCEARSKLLIMQWVCVGLFAALGVAVVMLMFR